MEKKVVIGCFGIIIGYVLFMTCTGSWMWAFTSSPPDPPPEQATPTDTYLDETPEPIDRQNVGKDLGLEMTESEWIRAQDEWRHTDTY